MKSIISFSVTFLFSLTVFSQSDTIVNPISIERIPYYEQLYRFRVNRFIDLGEKQNSGFKSQKSDIADFLFKAVKNGSLQPVNDTLASLDINTIFLKNKAVLSPAWDANVSYDINGPASYNDVNFTSAKNDNKGHTPPKDGSDDWWQKAEDDQQTSYFKTSDVVGIDLIEDVIFDKRRSRLYYDIMGIWLVRGSKDDANTNPMFMVSYKDFAKLVQRLSHSKNPKERESVLWRNAYNPTENKTFIDAFKLRLFHGVIEKVENPDDQTITDIFADNGLSYSQSIYARWEEEMKMMEKEHNLWEF